MGKLFHNFFANRGKNRFFWQNIHLCGKVNCKPLKHGKQQRLYLQQHFTRFWFWFLWQNQIILSTASNETQKNLQKIVFYKWQHSLIGPEKSVLTNLPHGVLCQAAAPQVCKAHLANRILFASWLAVIACTFLLQKHR